MFIKSVLQKYPALKRPEAIFEITNIAKSIFGETNSESINQEDGSKILTACTRGISHLREMFKKISCRPPYKIVSYEYKLQDCNVLIYSEYNEEIKGVSLAVFCNIPWLDIPDLRLRGYRVLEMEDNFCIDFDKPQKYNIDNNYIKYLMALCRSKNIKYEDTMPYEDINFWTNPIIYSNALLNCKNVSTDSHEFPNRRSIQHYKRIGKPYFEKYYTLKLTVPGSKKKREGKEDIDSDGYTRAFHICRGHFKIYTEANPLFGKYTGTYWWNSQVRGDVETGIIDKDYSLKQLNNNGL